MKLERAKTGDFLKHKIQRRPQRDELIQQHILEETFDPSYYEQERKLKKARLADDLNERLSQRPGPLELIKGNILHTDEFLEQAIKEGQITFKKTCEGEVIKNPPKRFVFEEESSSDSAPSPQLQANIQLNNSFILSAPSNSSNNNLISVSTIDSPAIGTTTTALNSSLSYIVSTPVTSILPNNATSTVFFTQAKEQPCLNTTFASPASSNSNIVSRSSIGPIKSSQSSKIKKKIKSKNQPRARVIKFHEYTVGVVWQLTLSIIINP